MSELDVDRLLHDDWHAFVAWVSPDEAMAVTIVESRGDRTTRPMIWAELEEVRQTFADLRAAIASDRSRAETLATTTWTVKDLIAHLASWAVEFRRQVETVARGDAFDYVIEFTPRIGPTAWNAREVARRRDQPIEASFDELDAATAGMQELALTLPHDVLFGMATVPQSNDGRPENRWRVRLADLMVMKCWHDRYHLERLEDVVR
jgi:hypothetical protein